MILTDQSIAGCPVGYACTVCRTPAPACTGFSDACGAAAGEPCGPY